jgi:hypothetical protein
MRSPNDHEFSPHGEAEGATTAYSSPYERDGATVITATRSRARTAAAGRRQVAMSGAKPVGAFVVRDGDVQWRPAVDVTRLLVTAEVVAGAIVVAQRLARRPTSPAARVTMGPGGWVSMKGGTVAVRPVRRPFGRPQPVTSRPEARAPLWARVLSAVPLQALTR